MPLLDLFWTMFLFFCWILWFWLLFRVYADLFSRRDIGGWAKTGWVLFTILLPFLGVFMYLITQGRPGFETRSAIMYIGQEGLREFRMGNAAAMSFLLTLALMLISVANFVFFRERKER